jgi:hypothetical protein
MKRIERDPEPWEYSEDSFRHLQASLVRADIKEQRKSASQVNWSAIKGAVIGTSISIVCWYGIIYAVLYVYGWIKQ